MITVIFELATKQPGAKMEPLDQYLSQTLKKGLTRYQPPANAKAVLLARAVQMTKQKILASNLLPKYPDNLYRIYINQAMECSEPLDHVMAAYSLELSFFQQRTLT